jgi:hypothetical protein
MTTKYTMQFAVRSAGFRKKLASARKIADGSVHELFEPLGYFVVLDPGGIAIKLGEEDLRLRPGQVVRGSFEL